jgi:hypothetical protein
MEALLHRLMRKRLAMPARDNRFRGTDSRMSRPMLGSLNSPPSTGAMR